jgi:hypothetical protein
MVALEWIARLLDIPGSVKWIHSNFALFIQVELTPESQFVLAKIWSCVAHQKLLEWEIIKTFWTKNWRPPISFRILAEIAKTLPKKLFTKFADFILKSEELFIERISFLVEVLRAIEHRPECETHLHAIKQFVTRLRYEPEGVPIAISQQKFAEIVDHMIENDCLDDGDLSMLLSILYRDKVNQKKKATALAQLLIRTRRSALSRDVFVKLVGRNSVPLPDSLFGSEADLELVLQLMQKRSCRRRSSSNTRQNSKFSKSNRVNSWKLWK